MLRVGLDIGGTKTAAIAVDDAGRIAGRAVCPTDVTSPARLVASAADAAAGALAAAGRALEDVVAAGAGVPGQVDPVDGTVRLAVNLNLTAPFPLRAALEQALGVPAAVENDVRAAAWGAYDLLRRQGQPVNSLAYLSIGTGIAAGLVLDGRLYRGAHGMAGEIGHIPVDPAGPRCACGAYGCLEALAAGPAIAAHAASLMGIPSRESLTTGDVYALAAGGHSAARQAADRAAYFLSRAIYLLVMTYDVEKVVLGGGVTHAGDAFQGPLQRALADLRADSSLATTMLPDDKVVLAPADYNAGLVGAVLLAPTPTGAQSRDGR